MVQHYDLRPGAAAQTPDLDVGNLRDGLVYICARLSPHRIVPPRA